MKDGAPFGIAGIWENWKEPASGDRLCATSGLPHDRWDPRDLPQGAKGDRRSLARDPEISADLGSLLDGQWQSGRRDPTIRGLGNSVEPECEQPCCGYAKHCRAIRLLLDDTECASKKARGPMTTYSPMRVRGSACSGC
jgi:hypothetical protein